MAKIFNNNVIGIIVGSVLVVLVVGAGLYFELIHTKATPVESKPLTFNTTVITENMDKPGVFDQTVYLNENAVITNNASQVEVTQEELGKPTLP